MRASSSTWRQPIAWLLLWWVFGNAEDGPYARYGGKGVLGWYANGGNGLTYVGGEANHPGIKARVVDENQFVARAPLQRDGGKGARGKNFLKIRQLPRRQSAFFLR